MNLERPRPHEIKDVLRRHNISVSSVAQFMDLSFNYVSNLVNGISRVTPENEKKFREIIEHLEGNGGQRAK